MPGCARGTAFWRCEYRGCPPPHPAPSPPPVPASPLHPCHPQAAPPSQPRTALGTLAPPSSPAPPGGGLTLLPPTPRVSGPPTSLPASYGFCPCAPTAVAPAPVPPAACLPLRHAACCSSLPSLCRGDPALLLSDSVPSEPATVCVCPPRVLPVGVVVSCSPPLPAAPVDRPFGPLARGRRTAGPLLLFLRKHQPSTRLSFSFPSLPSPYG